MKTIGLWLATFSCAGLANALDIVKANNALPLNDPGSWVGGAAPGSADTAVWDATVTGENTADIGAAQTWGVLRVANPGGPVTINGAQRLTLAGSANPDLDLSAATQDLTFNNPVTLSGGSFDLPVAAGRTVTLTHSGTFGGIQKTGAGTAVVNNPAATGAGQTAFGEGTVRFTGTGAFSHKLRWNGGTAVFDGTFNLTSTDTEGLAIYKGTLVLAGGSFNVTNASGARIFAGRTNTDSDGTIIVSNGTHRIPGGNGGDSSESSFIGVSNAKRGRLIVEGGELMFNYLRLANNNKGGQVTGEPDLLTVNSGLFQILGSNLPFKMGSGHAAATKSERSGRLTVNGGRFEIPNGDTLLSHDHAESTGTQEILLNGGTWAVKKIVIGNSPSMRTVTFNGGALEGTNALNGAELIANPANAVFLVRAGGAILGAANGSDFRFSANLAEDPASPGGGLVKTGPGRLTLAGTHTYTGPTVVSNGWLVLAGSLPATELFVASGAGLSLADGALSTFAPSTGLRLGLGTEPSRLEVEAAASGNACDRLAVPADAWFGHLAVHLVQEGTRSPVTREGDFAVLSYAGAAPAAAAFSWGNPAPGFACTFDVDTAQKLVYARVRIDTAPGGDSVWIAPASGAWSAPANWNLPPADSPETRVLFSPIPAAPVTVALDAPAAVGAVTFDNANAYTLTGAGPLALGGGASVASLTLAQGSHTVAAPLALAAPVTVHAPAASQTLTLAAPLSGYGALLKTGNGDLVIGSSENTYAGGTTLSQGNITVLQPGATFGSGPIRLNAAMGGETGRLRNRSGDTLTITNDMFLGVAGASIEANNGPVILEGTLDWQAGGDFNKAGTQELALKGRIAETSGRINIRNGSIRAAAGAEIAISASARDTLYLSESSGTPRSFTVEAGATVRVGGLTTGACPSNTVTVNGGSLTLTGHSTETGLFRQATGYDGADRIIVNAGEFVSVPNRWLSLGVRGGGAEVIVNGGRASFGQLSLGVRADAAFASTGAPTYANLFLNGGTTEVANVLVWLADITPGRTNRVFLNGGVLRLPTTFRSVDLSIASGSQFTLNGGALELTGLNTYNAGSLANYLDGLTDLFVDQDGAVIDTLGLNATVTQAVQRVGATSGGLTKRGAGSLTFTAPAAFTGPTVVEQGALRFAAGAVTTDLTLAPGATFSLRGGAADALALSSAAFGAGARIDLDLGDTLALPEDVALGGLTLGLYPAGAAAVIPAGTYPVFSYIGTAPAIDGLALAPDCFGDASFVVNAGAQTIDLVVADSPNAVSWANAEGGAWSAGANWTPFAPATSGARIRFGDALAADATVEVDAPASVASMLFDSPFAYTLSGSPLTLQSEIRVLRGIHTLAAPLAADDGATAALAPGAALRVTDLVTGAGTFTVTGSGTLALDGTNTLPAAAQGGATIAVPTPDSLGSAPLALDGATLDAAQGGTVANAVTLGAAGGTFRAGTGQTVTLAAAVGGEGGFAKTGPGIFDVGANAAYAGATLSDGGTLSFTDAFPAGPLTLGRGTLAFTGTGATAQPVTLASGTNAAVVKVDGGLTFNGPLTTLSGALFKAGSGTLAFNGRTEILGPSVLLGNSNLPVTFGVDGDGPRNGIGGLTVADGTVVLGANGETNILRGEVYVGANTTAGAGAETAGHLVIAGGHTEVANYLCVGRNNGSAVTAPQGLSSSVTVNDGMLVASNISLSANTSLGEALYTGRPELTVNGGTLHVIDAFYAGNAPGSVGTIAVTGGTLRHEAVTQSLRLGQTQGEGVLRVTGGEAFFVNDVVLAYGGAGATGTVELSGGTLACKRLYQYSGTGYGRVLFNGGVLKPQNGIDNSISELKIGEAPAIIDTSSAAAAIVLDGILAPAGAADGGLVKLGTGELAVTAPQAYTGPTVVSNGTLGVNSAGALPAASALAVAPGATVRLNNAAAKTVALSGLTLGDASDPAPAALILGIDSSNATHDRLAVAGDVTAHRASLTLFWQSSPVDNIVANGRYPLITWTGNGPATVDAFTVANPASGKAYTLSVSANTLWLDVGPAASGAHVWSAAAGGNWSEASNWLLAPGAGAPGATVRFDTSAAAPAAVQVNQAATLGGLYFNNTNGYTLAGGSTLTVDNGAAPATVQVEAGAHTVAAPLALTGETLVKPISGTALALAGPLSGDGTVVKQNGGDLILASPANSFTGGVRLAAAGVVLTNGASAGPGPVAFESTGTYLKAGGTGTATAGPLAVRAANPVTAEVAPGAALAVPSLGFGIGGAAEFHKQGAGELVFTGTTDVPDDTKKLTLDEGTVRFAAGSDFRFGTAGRDTVWINANNGASRALVVDAGAHVRLSGIYAGNGTNSIAVDGRLDLTGTADDTLCLRVFDNNAEDRFTVGPGGLLTSSANGWFNIGIRGPGVFTVAGGEARLGSVVLGFRGNPYQTFGGRYARVYVRDGGLLDASGRWNWMGDSNNLSRVNWTSVEPGGTLRIPPTSRLTSAGWSTLALDGGTLKFAGPGLDAPDPANTLRGLTRLLVGPGGATLDTDGQNATVAQDPVPDASDTVLAKEGAGTLAFTQPLKWPGTLDVRAGVLRADLAPGTFTPAPVTNGLLARYSSEAGPGYDSSGRGRHGTAYGSAISGATDAGGRTGLNFPTGSIVTTPMDAETRGMVEYTVAMWVKRSNVSSAGGTASTFFTTRMSNNNAPYQFMLRIVSSKLRFMGTGATENGWTANTHDSTLTVPENEWFHAACAVTAGSLKLYVNGQPAGSWSKTNLRFCPPDRPLGDLGFGVGHPYLKTNPSGEFSGQIDDAQIFSRALSDAEIASLAAVPAPELPALRVANGSVFAAQGATNAVRTLSGEGYVSGGLTVRGLVSPGDAADAPAGTSLLAERLTLGTNIVYRWDWSPAAADAIRAESLTIAGAGTLDLGREEGQLISGSFRAVLMTYDTLAGAAHLADWTVVNAGGKGYVAVIKAEDGEVVLEYQSTRGSLMFLK